MAVQLALVVRNTDRSLILAPGQQITVGRTRDNDLQLEDPSVSRQHCFISHTDDGVLLVRDRESANGTYINERSVKEGTAHIGDVIRLGAALLDVAAPGEVHQAPLFNDTVMVVDNSKVESIIQRRIEPSNLDWLGDIGARGGPELALLQRAQRHLSALHRVSGRLAGARDAARLADVTLGAVLDVISADRTAIVLRRPAPDQGPGGETPEGRGSDERLGGDRVGPSSPGDDGEYEILAAHARTPTGDRFSVSRTLVADVIGRGVSVFAHDATHDARFSEGQSVVAQHIRSVMCVPLRTTDDVLGALYADSQSGPGRFNETDLELLAAIGNQAGVALHRVRLLKELQDLLLDTIKAIAATIDARDGYTHRHSERVSTLTGRLARELGLSDEQRETAELSALLHDVGKIAVSDAILNKPGKLTPDEYAEMQKHPVHGAWILGNIQSPTIKAVLPGVRYHHERWDGSGYPEGLTGEAIPFLGRLIGVADFYDAVASARSYRPALSVEQAVQMVRDGAGKHFDPSIADALVRLYERGALGRIGEPAKT